MSPQTEAIASNMKSQKHNLGKAKQNAASQHLYRKTKGSATVTTTCGKPI